jgi:hypothetical protein
MDSKFLRSIALKGLYVVIASAVLGLSGWLDANPNVGLWTMDSLKIAVAASIVAGVKKFVTGFFTGE